jgi:hypothetical protein
MELFLMFRKKYFFIIFLIITIYLFFTNVKKKISVDVSASNPSIINQDTSPKPWVDDKLSPQLKQSNANTLSCAALDQATNIDKKNKASFISTKAIQWYFEGYDKYKIAETLAAMFSYSVAIQWIEDINTLSVNHVKHSELIQTIDSLSYTNDFLTLSKYMQSISYYQPDVTSDESGNINQRLNQYPDLAVHHWNIALSNALHNKKTVDALNAIKQLKTYIKVPMFFQHPLNSPNTYISLSSFSQQDIVMIIAALFDLAPVIFEDNNRYKILHKQMLTGLNVDESQWRFKQVNNDDFTINFTIDQLVNNVRNEFPSLAQSPTAKNFCVDKNINIALKRVDVAKFNEQKSKNLLSPAWQGVNKILCPGRTFFSGYITIRKQLNTAGILMEDLTDFESLQKNSLKLNKAIAQFDEHDRSMLFAIIYMNKQFELAQIKELVSSKITPSNSDFYFLLRQLPLSQQKELLLEYQYELINANNLNFSIAALAIQFGASANSSEIIPFLIEQGFPLKENESSPDPLWMLLYLMSVDNHYKELPIRSISSLIDHTTLNETHIDIMYKIKQKNNELYENLIAQFSELKFDAPEELIEINCL